MHIPKIHLKVTKPSDFKIFQKYFLKIQLKFSIWKSLGTIIPADIEIDLAALTDSLPSKILSTVNTF